MKSLLAFAVLGGMLMTETVMFAEVIIKTAPPAPVSVAVVGRAPATGYVWVAGYYQGVGGRYVWVAGKWMRPPRVGMVWVAPMWRRGPSGYVFVAGRWR
jgi:hypothetical protein